MFAAGVRAVQSIDAMAVIYMVTTLVWLLIALRFVNPTQIVTRVKEHPQAAIRPLYPGPKTSLFQWRRAR